MCDECLPYMEEGFTHAVNACPLLQGAYCGYCTVNGHYMTKCPNRPIARRFRKDPIPSEKPEPITKNLAIIGHNNLTYMEYLGFHGIEPKLKLEENKELVKQHLAKHGYELAESQMPPTKTGKNIVSK
jgi:hypothetical protein